MTMEQLTTLRDLEDLFVSVLGAITEERVIIEDASGPQPDGPYVSLRLESLRPNSFNERRLVERESDGELVEYAAYLVYCALKVSFWGQDACNRAARCQMQMSAAGRFFDLWRVIGFGGCDPVRRASAEDLGKIQERADFVFNFHANLDAVYHDPEHFADSRFDLQLPANRKPF